MSASAISERQPHALRLAASTSSVMSLRALLEAFARAGGKPAALLRRIGVPAEALREPDDRVPLDALLRAWELAPELVGDDAFGLHVGARLPRGSFGLIEYLARTSATLGEGLERVVRFQRLLHDRARLSLALSDAQATISARIADLPGGAPRHFNEATITALLSTARDMTGVDIVPLEIAFQHAEPGSLAEHRRILRAPVRFGAAQNLVVVPRASLELRLRDADAGLVAVLERCAQHALARLPPISDGLRLCSELIATQIAAGARPNIDYIARELALSPRSLQRVLSESGSSFRDLVDDVRKELAIAWLTSSNEAAAQIGYRLGYADTSAFHHAFRRWTGKTVGEFRRLAREGQRA
jgi:AraC-like DNA-binding protein